MGLYVFPGPYELLAAGQTLANGFTSLCSGKHVVRASGDWLVLTLVADFEELLVDGSSPHTANRAHLFQDGIPALLKLMEGAIIFLLL